VIAVRSEENLAARPHGEQVVITLPEEIDITNSPRLRETLLAVISRRPAMVVADMAATTFCDCSGITAIVSAYRQAVAAGTDMRLVLGHPAPRRVFGLCGTDTVISIYPDLPTALSAIPQTTTGGVG
jgi:anti-sigma B factor antagonist